MIRYGAILIRCREKARLSQRQAAEQIGVSKSTYCAWEADKTTFNAGYFTELAKVFGVEITDLFPPSLSIKSSQSNVSASALPKYRLE